MNYKTITSKLSPMIALALLLGACDVTAPAEPVAEESAPDEALPTLVLSEVEGATVVLPTATPLPPTDTPVPPTETSVPTETAVPTDTPVPTPTEFAGGGQIVFASDRAGDGNLNLWSLDPAGGNLTQITTDFTQALFPDISPDGSQIAFGSMDSGMWSIYLVNPDGSNLTQLTDFSSAVADWSPDGTRLVFNSDHDDEPTDVPDLWAMNVDGTGLVELVDEPESVDAFPKWSPDGSQILFFSDRADSHDLYVMDADGSNQTALTTDPGGETDGKWSPDGSRIVFTFDGTGGGDLYLINADGSNMEQLTEDPALDTHATWSPDSNYIVFMSERSGTFDLWRIELSTGELLQLTDDEFLNFMPDW